MSKVGVYTSICEEDGRWFHQYLKEIDRLNLDFAINFDRCSETTKQIFRSHPHFVGGTEQDDHTKDFSEMDKQGAFDIIVAKGYDWGMAWDVDETWQADMADKLLQLDSLEADYVDMKFIHLWEDDQHYRTDGPFRSGHRVKFYNLKRYEWYFAHPVVNGLKHRSGPEPRLEKKMDWVCIHWGMMTDELRRQHKARWDRIYTKLVGANPYGLWQYALDPACPADVEDINA